MEEMDVLEIEIDKELKEQAEALLQKIGMDLETAIILFIAECVRIHGLPFELNDPLTNAAEFPLRERGDG